MYTNLHMKWSQEQCEAMKAECFMIEVNEALCQMLKVAQSISVNRQKNIGAALWDLSLLRLSGPKPLAEIYVYPLSELTTDAVLIAPQTVDSSLQLKHQFLSRAEVFFHSPLWCQLGKLWMRPHLVHNPHIIFNLYISNMHEERRDERKGEEASPWGGRVKYRSWIGIKNDY